MAENTIKIEDVVEDSKSKFKNPTLQKCWDNKWIILTLIVFAFQVWVIPKDTESIRFGPKLIDSLFTYFSFNTPITFLPRIL